MQSLLCVILDRFIFSTYSDIHSVSKKVVNIVDFNSRISLSMFIIFLPVETRMNTAQFYIIYLLNSLMTSYSLTVVYMLKLPILCLKINF